MTFEPNEVEVGVARSASAVQWARARSEATGGWEETLAATVVGFPHLRHHQVAAAGRGARRDRMAMGTRSEPGPPAAPSRSRRSSKG